MFWNPWSSSEFLEYLEHFESQYYLEPYINRTLFHSSNQVTFTAKLEPADKVTFHLRYEELLQRSEKGQYNYELNFQPKNQIVNDFKISIKVNESLPLKDISVKCIRDEEKAKFEAETITQEVLEFDQKSAPHEATIEFDPRLFKSATLTTAHLTQHSV